MYNILKQQDELKNASDNQLKLYMSSPTGLYPQYLVMTEMQRREKMRAEFSGGEPLKTTMAEEMSGEAPPEPEALPQGDPSQGAPPEDPNAQGIMSLPNDTTAGAVMKSRITGQPQMAGNMVANAPQGMAEGGSVAAPRANPFASSIQSAPQFGSTVGGGLFAGAGPTASNVSTALPTFTQNTPPPAAPVAINNQFGVKPRKPQTSNVQTRNTGLNIPRGTAPPKAGTAGLRTTYTGKDGTVPHYSWESAAARDAYIKSMTKPAATPAATPTVAPTAMAGGGPIYLSDGGIFDDWAGNETTPEEVYATMRDSDITDMLGKKASELNTTFGAFGGNPVTLTREGLLAEVQRRNKMNPLKRGVKDIGRFAFPFVDTATEIAKGVARVPGIVNESNAGLGNAMHGAILGPNPFGNVPIPEDAYGMSERGNGSAPTKSYVPSPSANAPQKKLPPSLDPSAPPAAPPSSGVSGLPPKGTPASGGLADLLKKFEGNGATEDYMGQMRALLDKQRGDPEELAKQDINMALMQAGFGMMASKNPNFFGAVGEGAMPALTAYGQSKSERKKDERALTASEMEALGINAKMSQEERANAQARAIAIDNARREDEAANFKYGPEAAETMRHNKAVESVYASRASDALDAREYLADLKTKATIEGTPVFRRTQEQKDFLINFAAKYAAINGGGGGGGMTLPFNAQYDPKTGQRIQ